MALPDGLLNAVKNYLDITYDDAQGDLKLTGIVERGMKYIDKAAGAAQDYTVEDKARELLFDYCRYARSNALEMFQVNYLHELLSLQIAQEVADRMDGMKQFPDKYFELAICYLHELLSLQIAQEVADR